jgi:anti-sigma factor RsiW
MCCGEELMEYVDGEGTAAARIAIETHLGTCAACRQFVADQRRLTDRLQAWQVAPPPPSLRAPQARPAYGWWQPSRPIAAGLAAAAIVLFAVALNQRPKLVAPEAQTIAGGRTASSALREVPPAPAGPASAGAVQSARAIDSLSVARDRAVPQAGIRTPSVIRTARLQIVASDFSSVRATVESIVSTASGFIDLMTVTGDTSRARVLRGTLRVPGDRLATTLARLRALGQVTEDTQGTQDVTDQIVDLDARMASARATEQRLTELLRNRTGRLSDVLEVERELTRVRLDIERLDGEKTSVTRRVSYASVEIVISEERKDGLDGPVSLTTRLKVAALDGVESALDSIAAVILVVLRTGPSLVFWGGLAAAMWFAFRRIKESPRPTASE